MSEDFDQGYQQGAESRQGEIDRLRQEIAEAREACPVVRQDQFEDAPLLTLVKEQVSLLFRLQSRADAAYVQQDRAKETVEEKSNDES